MFQKLVEKRLNNIFNRREDDKHFFKYFTAQDFEGLIEEKYEFKSNQGQMLRGGIYYFNTKNLIEDKLVIFCHGMGAGYLAYMHEIFELAKMGFKVLSYDYTATFSSEGNSLVGFHQPLVDLDYACKSIRENEKLKDKKIIIIGHSWGGFTALNSTNFIDNVYKVVAFAGPISYKNMLKDQFYGLMRIFVRPALKVERKKFGKYADYSALDVINNDTPKMIIHSTDDNQVNFKSNFIRLKDANTSDKNQFVAVRGKGHNPNYTNDASKYLQVVFASLKGMLKEKKNLEEIQGEMKKVNWKRACAQDENVWKIVEDFLKR